MIHSTGYCPCLFYFLSKASIKYVHLHITKMKYFGNLYTYFYRKSYCFAVCF